MTYTITVTAMAYAVAEVAIDATCLDEAIVKARLAAAAGEADWKLDGVDTRVIGAEGAELRPLEFRRTA